MSFYEIYLSKSSEICKQLHELGYTPHSIVQEAKAEGLSVWEYIAIMFDFY